MPSHLASHCCGGCCTLLDIAVIQKGPHFRERTRAEIENIPQNIHNLPLLTCSPEETFHLSWLIILRK